MASLRALRCHQTSTAAKVANTLSVPPHDVAVFIKTEHNGSGATTQVMAAWARGTPWARVPRDHGVPFRLTGAGMSTIMQQNLQRRDDALA